MIYQSIENDYHNQSNALLSIIGKSVILFDKTGALNDLQNKTITRFSKPLPRICKVEAREQVSIIDNRMDKLKKYAFSDDPYFNHLYHLTLEKIKNFIID